MNEKLVPVGLLLESRLSANARIALVAILQLDGSNYDFSEIRKVLGKGQHSYLMAMRDLENHGFIKRIQANSVGFDWQIQINRDLIESYRGNQCN